MSVWHHIEQKRLATVYDINNVHVHAITQSLSMVVRVPATYAKYSYFKVSVMKFAEEIFAWHSGKTTVFEGFRDIISP